MRHIRLPHEQLTSCLALTVPRALPSDKPHGRRMLNCHFTVAQENSIVTAGGSVVILLISMLLCSSTACAQSTCAFIGESPLHFTDVPSEPRSNGNLTVCKPNIPTCCTREMEAHMQQNARSEVERLIQGHVIGMQNIFEEYALRFRDAFLEAMRDAKRQLHHLFSRSYGPFYTSNAKVFNQFFDELNQSFAVDRPYASVKSSLEKLFSDIYVVEFSLLNPLKRIGNEERACMLRMQQSLRPFGSIPKKIGIQLQRTFVAWSAFVRALEKTADQLRTVVQHSLSMECVSAIVRSQHCTLCSGERPSLRPCRTFCTNSFKGCLAELAELEPEWNALIDSVVKMSGRLKSAYNPFSVLPPVPVQISEAIMTFQEKGPQVSNSIVMECFTPGFRLRRDVIESGDRYTVVDEAISQQDDIRLAEQRTSKTIELRRDIGNFVDKALRFKGVWKNLPITICDDLAFASVDSENCWNGTAAAPYNGGEAPEGVAWQRCNPEFGRSYKGVPGIFLDQTLRFAMLANLVDAAYDGRPPPRNAARHVAESNTEGSGFGASPDDEDSPVSSGALPVEVHNELMCPALSFQRVSEATIAPIVRTTASASYDAVPNRLVLLVFLMLAQSLVNGPLQVS